MPQKTEFDKIASTEKSNCKLRPVVSVIRPTYNMAQYLHMAIDSVLYQTYENYEIITGCRVD